MTSKLLFATNFYEISTSSSVLHYNMSFRHRCTNGNYTQKFVYFDESILKNLFDFHMQSYLSSV